MPGIMLYTKTAVFTTVVRSCRRCWANGQNQWTNRGSCPTNTESGTEIWGTHYTPVYRESVLRYALLVKQTESKLFFKVLFISHQIVGIQTIYNLICCPIVLSPQSWRSEVQRLFSLLLFIGCVSVSNGGLGWDSSLLRCLSILSLMTSLTYGMLRSVWSVWFVTYQGAFAMVLRIFDCDLCMIKREIKIFCNLVFSIQQAACFGTNAALSGFIFVFVSSLMMVISGRNM